MRGGRGIHMTRFQVIGILLPIVAGFLFMYWNISILDKTLKVLERNHEQYIVKWKESLLLDDIVENDGDDDFEEKPKESKL